MRRTMKYPNDTERKLMIQSDSESFQILGNVNKRVSQKIIDYRLPNHLKEEVELFN